MNLFDIMGRDLEPQPWAEDKEIPWDDSEFSRRMLKQHRSQKHDAASRRSDIIKKHVDWIHSHVLDGKPSRILELGCGPGFYTSQLATLGHVCHGIDFSPASIEYAVKNAPENCSYTLGDIRTTEYGSDYDLVMLIYGVFNVFNPEDAKLILQKADSALKMGGKLLLEISTFDAVVEMGNQPAVWYSAEDEFFADKPHLCLLESFWTDEQAVAIERYYIVDASSGDVTLYSVCSQAYTEGQLRKLLNTNGFDKADFYPSLLGKEHDSQSEMFVQIGYK